MTYPELRQHAQAIVDKYEALNAERDRLWKEEVEPYIVPYNEDRHRSMLSVMQNFVDHENQIVDNPWFMHWIFWNDKIVNDEKQLELL